MNKTKIKAPCNNMEFIQLKLSILYLSFLNTVNLKIFLVLNMDSIDENLIRLEKRGKIYFKNKIATCLSCKSTHNVKNGFFMKEN